MAKAVAPHAPLIMGAVAYDPKVVSIWDGFRHYFRTRDLDFDYVLYSTYERQVQAHTSGHVHVAWNSPLAWLQTERVSRSRGKGVQAIAMRDTDRDLRSIILVRSDSSINTIAELKGRTVAVGSSDSPQATLIPLNFLAEHGLEGGKDFQVSVFDVSVGKHGDHIGGERDAVRALLTRTADAACILDANHLAFGREGTIPRAATKILAQTPAFDHCNFTIIGDSPTEAVVRFQTLLLGMSYSDADVRPLLDLEGLKQWLPGRVSGYAQLSAAVDRFGTLDPFISSLQEQWK
ncbi:MAG TPA: PhnD/SsuA/transferrin family substrate-binding protein [Vicinamibacterales bacterium]|jgi:ABC-type phosphate/phosphonate transport system substrate-binding protein|nr:PhnD/SsuA/transferrin family substrate-binding protein [Vicinamibacterales bacterium]